VGKSLADRDIRARINDVRAVEADTCVEFSQLLGPGSASSERPLRMLIKLKRRIGNYTNVCVCVSVC